MSILFYLGHPAHFHLFKNVIWYLKAQDHKVHILIKKKDVLEDLLKNEGLEYLNIFPKTRGSSKIAMAKTILKRNLILFNYCRKHKPDLLVGTSVENTHIGTLLRIPTINLNEDDYNVVPLYSKLSYPFTNTILCPTTCATGKWEHKTVHYQGYHELAYLHPNHFTPNYEVVKKYIPAKTPYFLIRFAKLNAHHDKGIRGIDNPTALKIIERLSAHGKVYITAEKHLDPEFEPYRLNINPIDMHHVMAFAKIYIGDSQTMAAEAGVLGVPFIRFNDFVGRIGYLNELENKYQLGFGISPSEPNKLFAALDFLLGLKRLSEIFQDRRQKMLNDKIDVSKFLIWFVENYPKSHAVMDESPAHQYNFAMIPTISKQHVQKTEIFEEKITSKIIPLRQF